MFVEWRLFIAQIQIVQDKEVVLEVGVEVEVEVEVEVGVEVAV